MRENSTDKPGIKLFIAYTATQVEYIRKNSRVSTT